MKSVAKMIRIIMLTILLSISAGIPQSGVAAATSDVITSPKIIGTTVAGGTVDTVNGQAVKGPVYVYASGATSSLGETLIYSYRIDTPSGVGTWTTTGNSLSISITADGIYTVSVRVEDTDGIYDKTSSWNNVAFQINNSIPVITGASPTSDGIKINWENPSVSDYPGQTYTDSLLKIINNDYSVFTDNGNVLSGAQNDFAGTNWSSIWIASSSPVAGYNPTLAAVTGSNMPSDASVPDTAYLAIDNRSGNTNRGNYATVPVSGVLPFHVYKFSAWFRFPNKDGNSSNTSWGSLAVTNSSNDSIIASTQYSAGSQQNLSSNLPNSDTQTAFKQGTWVHTYIIFNSMSNSAIDLRYSPGVSVEMDVYAPTLDMLSYPTYASGLTGASYTDNNASMVDTTPPTGAVSASSVQINAGNMTKTLTLASTAADAGQTYQYEIAATGSQDGITRTSAVSSVTNISGLQGYFYRIDNSSATESLSAGNSTFVSYSSGTPPSIDVSGLRKGTYYLHTSLLDVAGNQAADAVSTVSVPGLVSVTYTANAAYIVDPDSNTLTMPVITLTNNSGVDSVQVTLQSLASALSGTNGFILGARVLESAAGSSTWSEIDNSNVQLAGGASTILGVLCPGGTGHVKLVGTLGSRRWPEQATDSGSLQFTFVAVS